MKTDKPLHLPNSSAKQIVAHWTGGSYTPSSLDRHHYHFLIDGDGVVHHGEYPINANDKPLPTTGEYAAHVRTWNTDTIGIAVCCMFGAKERPFESGPYPIRRVQWDVLAELTAVLCEHYSISVDKTHVLMHSEVAQNIGIQQRGKWDINAVPSTDDVVRLYHPETAGNAYRGLVTKSLQGPGTEPRPITAEYIENLRIGLVNHINDACDALLDKLR